MTSPPPGVAGENLIPVRVYSGHELNEVRQWLSDRPRTQRWRVIADRLFTGLDLQGVSETTLGACMCCVGALAMRVTLDRVIRGGQVDGIVLLLGDPDHMDWVRDMLKGSQYVQLLHVDERFPANRCMPD